MTQNDRQADLELDIEINKDFEENSPYQGGIISQIYQRPNKSQIGNIGNIEKKVVAASCQKN